MLIPAPARATRPGRLSSGAYPVDVPAIVDQAVPLRVWDWSETSQTALFFTREHGLLRALAKGAKRERGRFSGGIEMLTRGELVALSKPASELATLTEWDLQEVFRKVRIDLDAHRAGLAFVELIQAFLTDRDPHPVLWDGLVEELQALETGAMPLGPVARLLWRCLVEAGYTPDLALPGEPCGAATAFGFDPALGRVTVDPGPESGDGRVWRVRSETVGLLRVFAGEEKAPRDFDPAKGRTLERAARLLMAYATWVLGRPLPVAEGFVTSRAAVRPESGAEAGPR